MIAITVHRPWQPQRHNCDLRIVQMRYLCPAPPRMPSDHMMLYMVSVFVQGAASAYNVIYAKRRAAGKSRRAEHSRNRGKSVKPLWLSVRTVNASGSVAATFWTKQCGTTIGNGRKSRQSLVSILYLSNIGTSSHRTAFCLNFANPNPRSKTRAWF